MNTKKIVEEEINEGISVFSKWANAITAHLDKPVPKVKKS